MNAFPWDIFLVLLVAGLLGTAAVIPYALAMNPKAVATMKAKSYETGEAGSGGKRLPSMPVLVLISALQTIILIGLSTFLGLLAAGQVGLGTPILEAWLAGGPVKDLILAMAPAAILFGIVAGVVMLALEWTIFMPRIPRSLASLDARTAFWKRVLACFYGGIVEEILMRLFVMSVLVWLIGLLWKTPAGDPTVGAFWLANLLAALLFGAGHLPATSQTAKLTPAVVIRALLLNGIPGVMCGYLYMQYGLEAAMLLHFSLDIVLHLIAPPISQRLAAALPPEPAGQPV